MYADSKYVYVSGVIIATVKEMETRRIIVVKPQN